MQPAKLHMHVAVNEGGAFVDPFLRKDTRYEIRFDNIMNW